MARKQLPSGHSGSHIDVDRALCVSAPDRTAAVSLPAPGFSDGGPLSVVVEKMK